jgi:hypothetical protein
MYALVEIPLMLGAVSLFRRYVLSPDLKVGPT